MVKNEQRLCGEWAVFYHSYSHAALLYEVMAAVAAVIFRFKSTFASLPRLQMITFKKLRGASELMAKIKNADLIITWNFVQLPYVLAPRLYHWILRQSQNMYFWLVIMLVGFLSEIH